MKCERCKAEDTPLANMDIRTGTLPATIARALLLGREVCEVTLCRYCRAEVHNAPLMCDCCGEEGWECVGLELADFEGKPGRVCASCRDFPLEACERCGCLSRVTEVVNHAGTTFDRDYVPDDDEIWCYDCANPEG